MPEKITFNHNDLFRDAVVSASSEAGTLEAENAQDPLVDNVWRATGCTDEWLKFDLGSAKTINEIDIINHNLTTASNNIVIQANSSDSWTSPAFELTVSAWESGQSNSGIKTIVRPIYFTAQTYRHWRIRYIDPTNPDGYVEAGRVMGGKYFESGRNYNKGWQQNLVDFSKITLAGPTDQIDKEGKRNRFALPIGYISNDEKFSDWLKMFFNAGNTERIVMCLEPGTAEGRNLLSIYGKFEGDLPMAHQMIESYGTKIEFLEEIGDQS